VGEIVRDDGSVYDSEQLADLLSCLHFCLSFSLGRWIGIALPIGFANDGTKVFEQWGLPVANGGSWHGGTNAWFDEHHGESLAQVFPGFFALWRSPVWRTPLERIIYFYLSACQSSGDRVIATDVGLILAQAGLELLAWNYIVQDRRTISEERYMSREFSGARRIRSLLNDLRLSLELQPKFHGLRPESAVEWDAMDLITSARNSIVHPRQDLIVRDEMSWEIWRLSIWYLDLVILRLCNYYGEYGNRLTREYVGQVEQVLWIGEDRIEIRTDCS
jgi:hypothetical protein